MFSSSTLALAHDFDLSAGRTIPVFEGVPNPFHPTAVGQVPEAGALARSHYALLLAWRRRCGAGPCAQVTLADGRAAIIVAMSDSALTVWTVQKGRSGMNLTFLEEQCAFDVLVPEACACLVGVCFGTASCVGPLLALESLPSSRTQQPHYCLPFLASLPRSTWLSCS